MCFTTIQRKIICNMKAKQGPRTVARLARLFPLTGCPGLTRSLDPSHAPTGQAVLTSLPLCTHVPSPRLAARLFSTCRILLAPGQCQPPIPLGVHALGPGSLQEMASSNHLLSYDPGSVTKLPGGSGPSPVRGCQPHRVIERIT